MRQKMGFVASVLQTTQGSSAKMVNKMDFPRGMSNLVSDNMISLIAIY